MLMQRAERRRRRRVRPRFIDGVLRPFELGSPLGLPRAARRRPLPRHRRSAQLRRALPRRRADHQPARRHGAAARARRRRPPRLPARPTRCSSQIELHDGVQSTVDFLRAARRPLHVRREPRHARLHAAGRRALPVPAHAPAGRARPLGRVARAGGRVAFTTVGNWRQHWRDVRFGGERLRLEQGRRVAAVPRPARAAPARPFELALSGYEPRRPRAAGARAAGRCATRSRSTSTSTATATTSPARAPSSPSPRIRTSRFAQRLVQRPQRDLPRRRPTGDHAGHRLRRGAADRRGPVRRRRRSTRRSRRSRRSRRPRAPPPRRAPRSRASTSTPSACSADLLATAESPDQRHEDHHDAARRPTMRRQRPRHRRRHSSYSRVLALIPHFQCEQWLDDCLASLWRRRGRSTASS